MLKIKSNFFKSICWVLVFALSWSQLIYAATPRELLEQAKASFGLMGENHIQGGGSSPSVLAQSQAQAQSAVNQQNTLQDLQNLNFNLTTQNQDTLTYVNGELSSIQRTDGSALNNIAQDAQGNIIGANLQLPDSTVQVLQNGNILGSQTADGSQVLYSAQTGRIDKVESPTGVETTYSYKDAQGVNITLNAAAVVDETILDNATFTTTYDHQSQLKEVFEKSTGKRTFYTSGMVDHIVNSDGSVVEFNRTTIGDETHITPRSVDVYTDTNGNIFHFNQGQVERVDLTDGSQILNPTFDEQGRFQGGALVDAAGYQAVLSQGGYSQINYSDGATLSQLNFIAGQLDSATLTVPSAYVAQIHQNNYSNLRFSDGTVVENISFDALGHFQSGRVIDLNGVIWTIDQGNIVRVELANAEGVLTNIVWNANQEIKDALLTKNNTQYFFTDKKLMHSIDAQGNKTIYNYSTASGGVLQIESMQILPSAQNVTTFRATSMPSRLALSKTSFSFSGNDSTGDQISFTSNYSSNRQFILNLVPGSGSFFNYKNTTYRNNVNNGKNVSLGINLLRGVTYNAELCWGTQIIQGKSQSGIQIWIWDASTTRPTAPTAFIKDNGLFYLNALDIKAVNAQILVDPQSSGRYSQRDYSLQHPATLNPAQSVDFHFNSQSSTNNRISFTAQSGRTQNSAGHSVSSSVEVDYQYGRWNIVTTNYDYTTHRNVTLSSQRNIRINQTLTAGKNYTFFTEVKNNKLLIYIYDSSLARPVTPLAVVDVISTQMAFSTSIRNAAAAGQLFSNAQDVNLSGSGASSFARLPVISKIGPIVFDKKDTRITPKTFSFIKPQSALLIDPFTSFRELVYDANHKLKSVLKTDGTLLSFENGLLKTAVDSSGNAAAYNFETDPTLGSLKASSLVRGGLTSTFDAEGKLSTIENGDNTLHYQNGQLDFVVNKDGSRFENISLAADGSMNNATMISASGDRLTFENKMLTRQTRADGSATVFNNGKAVESTNSDGRVYRYEVDPQDATKRVGHLSKFTDEHGRKVEFLNDVPSRITLTDGTVLTGLVFAENGDLKDAAVSLHLGGEVLDAFYRDGQLTEAYFADGRKVVFANGRLKEILFSTDTWKYTYQVDASGNLTGYSIQDKDQTRTFNAQNVLLKYESGAVTAFYENGVLKKIVSGDTTIENFELDAQGHFTKAKLTDPSGNIFQVENSALQTLTRPSGTILSYSGDLLSKVETPLGKTVDYHYTLDATNKVSDISVTVTQNGHAATMPFYEYLLNSQNTEEKPLVEAPFNLRTSSNAFVGLATEQTTTFIPAIQDPQDPQVLFRWDPQGLADTTNRTGVLFDVSDQSQSAFSDRFQNVSDEGFLFLRVKGENASPLAITPEWDMEQEALNQPVSAGTVLNLQNQYQDFVLATHAAAGSNNLARNVFLKFQNPLPSTAAWSVSLSQALCYRFERLDATLYSRYLLTGADVLKLNQMASQDKYENLLDSKSFVTPFNYKAALKDTAFKLEYDSAFTLKKSSRIDGTTVLYQNGNASQTISASGSRVNYVYQNGQVSQVITLDDLTGNPNLVTDYQYGKIRSVKKADGTLLYSYTYEFEAQQNETTVVLDHTSNQTKRFKNGQLFSSQNADGLVTFYFYDGQGRLARSEVRQENTLIQTYRYSYEGLNTLITDDSGATRIYDEHQNLIFIETFEGLRYKLSHLTDEQGNEIEQQTLYSARAADGIILFYKDDTVEKVQLQDGTIINISDQDPNLYSRVLLEQGLVSEITRTTGEVAKYVRDNRGRLQYVDVKAGTQTRRYNPDGRLLQVAEADGTSFEYGYLFDANGHVSKTRVIKRVPKLIGGAVAPVLSGKLEPMSFRADSGGLYDGWNASIIGDGTGVGEFNFNYWRQSYEAWQGRGIDMALFDSTGHLLSHDLFDLYEKGGAESDRLAQILEQAPANAILLLAVGDDGYTNLTDRAKTAIESFGSQDIRSLGFRDSYALIGRKGAAIGTAIEEHKASGQGYVNIQSYDTDYYYYDAQNNPIQFNQFLTLPTTQWQSSRTTYVGDDAEVFATEGIGASGFIKNYNAYYPNSGFIQLWNQQNQDFSDDAHVAQLLGLVGSKQEKYVFYDSRYASNFAPSYYSINIKNKLVAQGFQVVNADELRSVITSRGADTVIVMAQDIAPDTIYNPLSPFSISQMNLPRDFMERGGTMVWTHDAPFFYVSHADGTKDIVGEIGIKKMLGLTPRYRSAAGEVLGGQTQAPSFALPQNPLVLDANILNFEVNVNFRTIRWDKIRDEIGFTLSSDSAVVSSYDTDGDLVQLVKADRTVSVYDKEKLLFITDINGYMLSENVYDAQGNLIQIINHGARRDFENSLLDAKDKAEHDKYITLADFAINQNLVTQSFLDNVNQARNNLLSQRATIESSMHDLENQKMKGSAAKKQKSESLDLYRDAIRQVDDALRQLDMTAFDGVQTLTQQFNDKKVQLNQDIQNSFGQLETQGTNFRDELTRQETHALVTNYYRSIMGREPSASEAASYDAEALANNGHINIQNLSQNIRNSADFIARTARVQGIRGDISVTLDIILSGTDAEKQTLYSSLGLSSQEIASLSPQDIQKIKDYLNAQGLHFGESAVESLRSFLESQNIQVSFEELAKKLILTDILTGNLSPDTKSTQQLLISIYALQKVAALYGSTATAAKLEYDDLLSIYSNPSNQNARIVVHLSSVHFATITNVTATQVALVETDGSVHTLSKIDFLSAWKGYTLVKSSVVPTTLSSPSSRVLSLFESRQLKGGCFFLIPAIIGAIVSIATTVGVILSSIGAILASIGSIIAQSLTLLGQAIGGFLTQVGAFAGQIFQGIQYVGTTLFHGLASLFSLGAPQGVAAGTLKVSASEAIFHNVITIGVNYAVSKGLDALGVDPRISNLISSFVTGGIHGSFTATGMDFSNFFFDGLKNTLVAGSKDLLVHAGLDPKLAGVISLTAAPLFDGAWTGDINGSIQTIASNLPRDLTIYGIDRLGASIGLDPRINALLTTTVSSALNPTHTEAKTLGENIIRSVQDGLLRGVTALAINYAVDKMDIDPIFGALTANAITGGILGAFSRNGNILRGIFDSMQRATLSFLTLGSDKIDPNSPTYSYQQAQYLSRVMDFSSAISSQSQGTLLQRLGHVLEANATQIFTGSAVQNIWANGGIAQFLTGQATTRTVNGTQVTEVNFSSGGKQEYIYLDPATMDMWGRRYDKTILLDGGTQTTITIEETNARYGFDQNGKFGMLEGNVSAVEAGSGYSVVSEVDRGAINNAQIKEDPQATATTIATTTPVGLLFDQDANIFRDLDLELPEGYRMTLKGGYVEMYEAPLLAPSTNNPFRLGLDSNDDYLFASLGVATGDFEGISVRVQEDGQTGQMQVSYVPTEGADPNAVNNLMNKLTNAPQNAALTREETLQRFSNAHLMLGARTNQEIADHRNAEVQRMMASPGQIYVVHNASQGFVYNTVRAQTRIGDETFVVNHSGIAFQGNDGRIYVADLVEQSLFGNDLRVLSLEDWEADSLDIVAQALPLAANVASEFMRDTMSRYINTVTMAPTVEIHFNSVGIINPGYIPSSDGSSRFCSEWVVSDLLSTLGISPTDYNHDNKIDPNELRHYINEEILHTPTT